MAAAGYHSGALYHIPFQGDESFEPCFFLDPQECVFQTIDDTHASDQELRQVEKSFLLLHEMQERNGFPLLARSSISLPHPSNPFRDETSPAERLPLKEGHRLQALALSFHDDILQSLPQHRFQRNLVSRLRFENIGDHSQNTFPLFPFLPLSQENRLHAFFETLKIFLKFFQRKVPGSVLSQSLL